MPRAPPDDLLLVGHIALLGCFLSLGTSIALQDAKEKALGLYCAGVSLGKQKVATTALETPWIKHNASKILQTLAGSHIMGVCVKFNFNCM